MTNNLALKEAFDLSEEILRNLELSELPLKSIALKAARLSRILGNFDHQKIMEYEAGGYPQTINGIASDVWQLAEIAGRTYKQKNNKTGEIGSYANTDSLGQMEERLQAAKLSLEASNDRDVSISSANPNQYLSAPQGNATERYLLRQDIANISGYIEQRRTFIYNYVLEKHYELKYSGIANDIFSRIRKNVDDSIGKLIPDAVKRFSSVYDNLLSDNSEDWSNAVHSCRRIFQDLADAIYPPKNGQTIVRNGRNIAIGTENYINRIMCYIDDNSKSEKFVNLIGSHLRFVGDRLDSAFEATQKGSHTTITSRNEADRYVIYTYMLVGDILSLYNQ